MNPDHFEQLLVAWEDDTLLPAERAEFMRYLAASPAARQRWVEAGLLREIAAQHVPVGSREAMPSASVSRWQAWRPLGAAAAAGLVIGCFSTSMLWALNASDWVDGLRRIVLPLSNPGFERAEPLPQQHLVPMSDQWSGVTTVIVEGGGARPDARSGLRMMKLGAAPEGKGYFANLMTDLVSRRPLTDQPLQIEITAYYHASQAGQNEHYSLNVATFAEDPASVSGHWESSWRDLRDAALTNTGRAVFPTAGEGGWHRITVRLDVPEQARTLVLSMGSNTPGPVEGRTDHFMDDVTATWIIGAKTALP
jgi:hypothetical protein